MRLKTSFLLEKYFLPGNLKKQIGKFIIRCNHKCYHESLQNLTSTGLLRGCISWLRFICHLHSSVVTMSQNTQEE